MKPPAFPPTLRIEPGGIQYFEAKKSLKFGSDVFSGFQLGDSFKFQPIIFSGVDPESCTWLSS